METHVSLVEANMVYGYKTMMMMKIAFSLVHLLFFAPSFTKFNGNKLSETVIFY